MKYLEILFESILFSFFTTRKIFKVYLFIILMFFTHNNSFSQAETNIWCFSYHLGLDFNSRKPIYFSGSKNNTLTPTVISDSNGQLLYYGGSDTVWNRNHQFLFNGKGLTGVTFVCFSFIIPKPLSNNEYYIFSKTKNKSDGIPKLSYSIIDNNLDGGLGGISNSKKNILLKDSILTSNFISVSHYNNEFYWLIVQDYKISNRFFSYLIANTGINQPVISDVGFLTLYNTSVWLKISPDGKYLVIVYRKRGSNPNYYLVLLNFDNKTGKISNGKEFEINNIVGIAPEYFEYSPNGKYLYTLNGSSSSKKYLFQYDISFDSAKDIKNSAVLLYSSKYIQGKYEYCQLQLASNGRMYLGGYHTDSVGVINYPNQKGKNCKLNHNLMNINGTNKPYGLFPTFPSSYFYPRIILSDSLQCAGKPVNFKLYGVFPDSVRWNFGEITGNNGLFDL